MRVVFLADFFVDDITGGAEKNDATLIESLRREGIKIEKVHCHKADRAFVSDNRDLTFIVSNFSNLSEEVKLFIIDNKIKYIIYEHDYKFDIYRNPMRYKNFKVPESNLCNLEFYDNAHTVITLSELHRKIFEKNLPKTTNIKNINCSLFDDATLDFISNIKDKFTKIDQVGIIDSNNPIKCKNESIEYANKNNINFKLFRNHDYFKFLEEMSKFKKIIIFSGHPEPTPRTAVEAKLLGLKIICNKNNIGVANEYWFDYNHVDMKTEIKKIRQKAINLFLEIINE